MLRFWHDLQFWRHLSWQRTVLMLALAAMEVSWLTPFVMSLSPRTWDQSPLPTMAGLWLIMVILMAAGHFLSLRQVDSPAFELSVLAVIVGLGLLILRFIVFADMPLTSMRWLGEAFFVPGPRRLETFLVLGVLAILWWRGITFLQREVSFFVIGYDFRRGVLFLIAGLLLFTLLSHRQLTLVVYIFFFCSLLAVSLGRVEDKARTREGERPLAAKWLLVLVGAIVAVLLLAMAFSLLWNRPAFAAAAQVLAPTGSVFRELILRVLGFGVGLLEPILQWLVNLIRSTFPPEAQEGDLIVTVPSMAEILGIEEGTIGATGPPIWLRYLFRYVLPIVALGVGLLVLAIWLDRRRRRQRQLARGQRSQEVSSAEGEGLSQLWQRGIGRLRDWAMLMGQFGLGRRFLAAISVRNIYANVQRLGAQRGFPRHRAQTPNDYLPWLILAFPGEDDALAYITMMYNAYEYGEVPTAAAELERLRQAWTSVQEAAKKYPSAPPAGTEPPTN